MKTIKILAAVFAASLVLSCGGKSEKKNDNEKKMDVSMPMAILGFKDTANHKLRNAGYKEDNSDLVKKHVAMEILLTMIAGEMCG